MLLIKWVLFPAVPATLLLMLLTWRQGLDWRALVIAAAMLALLLPLCTGTSVVLLKWLRILKPAPGNIQQAGRRLAEREGAPLKSVLTMKLGIVNAFASVWTGDLILTSSALSVLNEEEINCVMAHEIGHLNESRLMRWRRLIILPGLISMGLMPAAASSGQTMAVFGFVAVYIVLRSLAHHHHNRMEVQADAAAVRSQISEGVYARALEKIHAAGLIPADFAAGHPYPSLHDRMISAGVRPDFPRLVPASHRRGVFAALAASAAFLVLWRFLILVAGG